MSVDNLLALITLVVMEIVLGIDNVIFISILVGKLPEHQRELARRLGLSFAMLTRLGLLFAINWVMHLTKPAITIMEHGFSGRDIILLVGGLFLIGKATHEIHDKVESSGDGMDARKPSSLASAIIQIGILDIIFSLDSVITAVGMADDVKVMSFAIIAAVFVMMFFAKAIGDFIDKHPTLKVLALSFLLLIGVMLVAEGFGKHVEKGYIYFAMGFSLFVEAINLRVRKKPHPVGQH